MRRFVILCVSVIAAFSVLFPVAAVEQDSSPVVSAQAAILLDLRSNNALYSKNADERLEMASTTKIMTALVAIEHGDMEELFKVCDESFGVEGSSIYLKKNESTCLLDLLYGLMLRSGNDAAVAIAYRVGGDIAGFAELMNEKAKAIGANNTHFANPNGLSDSEHYTTAHDLALIASEAMKNELFRKIVSTQYYSTVATEYSRTMQNKNKLLWQYEGANGVKTGYTVAAGKCFVFSAERDGMELLGVTLNSSNIFEDATALLDYGFENYMPYTLVSGGTSLFKAEVINGEKNQLDLLVKEDIIITIKKGEEMKLETRINAEKSINAPVEKDDVLGSLELYNGDVLISKTPLLAAETVLPRDFLYYMYRLFYRFVA